MMNTDETIKATLTMLEDCIEDPDFVGSVHGHHTLLAANEWLNSHTELSADPFYQQLQAAAVKYADIERVLDESDNWVGEHDE